MDASPYLELRSEACSQSAVDEDSAGAVQNGGGFVLVRGVRLGVYFGIGGKAAGAAALQNASAVGGSLATNNSEANKVSALRTRVKRGILQCVSGGE